MGASRVMMALRTRRKSYNVLMSVALSAAFIIPVSHHVITIWKNVDRILYIHCYSSMGIGPIHLLAIMYFFIIIFTPPCPNV